MTTTLTFLTRVAVRVAAAAIGALLGAVVAVAVMAAFDTGGELSDSSTWIGPLVVGGAVGGLAVIGATPAEGAAVICAGVVLALVASVGVDLGLTLALLLAFVVSGAAVMIRARMRRSRLAGAGSRPPGGPAP